jgi:hypothetical protein
MTFVESSGIWIAGTDRLAVRGHDRAIGGAAEITGAGVAGPPVGHLDLKISGAVDRDVEPVAGGRERALRFDARCAAERHAGADVQPGRIAIFSADDGAPGAVII